MDAATETPNLPPFWGYWGGNAGFRMQHPSFFDQQAHLRAMFFPDTAEEGEPAESEDEESVSAPSPVRKRPRSPSESSTQSSEPVGTRSMPPRAAARKTASLPPPGAPARARSSVPSSTFPGRPPTAFRPRPQIQVVRKTPPKKPQYPVNIFLVDFEFKCGSFSLFARLLSKKEHEAAMGDKKGPLSRATLLQTFCLGDMQEYTQAPKTKLDRLTLAQLYDETDMCCAPDTTFGQLMDAVVEDLRRRSGADDGYEAPAVPLSDADGLKSYLGPFPWHCTGRTRPGQRAIQALIAANRVWAVKIAEQDGATASAWSTVKPGGGLELDEALLADPFTFKHPSHDALALMPYSKFVECYPALRDLVGGEVMMALHYKVMEILRALDHRCETQDDGEGMDVDGDGEGEEDDN